MSNDNKDNLKADHGAHNRNEPHNHGLLLSFVSFMAWVIGIGLLLSLVACQPAKAQGVTYEQRGGNHE